MEQQERARAFVREVLHLFHPFQEYKDALHRCDEKYIRHRDQVPLQIPHTMVGDMAPILHPFFLCGMRTGRKTDGNKEHFHTIV